MLPKLALHLQPERGWINDPNGLCYFQGKYHAFFQHNPKAPVWDTMHWGHAVSEDLLHWEELPIALYPDQPYESGQGCFSGSAVEKDGRLYLFYTAVDSRLAQTQCLAWTDDGQHFTKYPGNPILPQSPIDPASRDFRDPKVFPWKDGSYRMVCGVGKEGYAAVVLYRSQDLLHWDYVGPLFKTREMGPVLECPDLFPLEDKWVLCFSRMDEPRCVQFVLGGFDGERFVPENLQRPALGPNFYAPQSFVDHQGRRILLGWMAPWERPMDQDEVRRGCLTVPLEPFLDDAGQLCLFPVEEAQPYLTQEDAHIRRGAWLFQVTDGEKILLERPASAIWDVRVLSDTHTCEVFLNGGEQVCSFYFQP